MERIPILGILAAAAVAALGAAEARAGVDAEVAPNLKAKGTLAPEGDRDLFRFQAGAGTHVSLKLTAQAGADLGFEPSLVGPGQASVPLDAFLQKGKTLNVPDLVLPADGTWTLEVKASGTGDYALQLKAKLKGIKATSLDVRADVLGRPGGGETFVRRLVGPAGGAFSVDDPGGEFDGAAVTIPGGALVQEQGLTLSSAPAPLDAVAGTRYAGPALAVGPAGLDLGSGTLVTVPFDGEAVPADGTVDDLRAALVDRKGVPLAVVPESTDEAAGTLTVQVPRGCTVVAASPDSIPRLVGNSGPSEYWMLSVGAGLGVDPSGDDSRNRTVEEEVGVVTLGSGGTGGVSVERRSWSFENRTGVPGPGNPPIEAGFQFQVVQDSFPFDWAVSPDGQGMVIGGPDSPAFRASRDGSVLVGRTENPGWMRAGLNVCLRKETISDPSALNGTWNVALLDVGAMGNSPDGPEDFSITRATGTVAFDGNGGARTTVAMRESRWEGGPWHDVTRIFAANVSYSIEADGTAILDLRTPQDSKAPVFRLRFGPRADVFLAADSVGQSNGGVVMFGVRQGRGMGPADLAGDYRGSVVGLSTDSYTAQSGPGSDTTVPDFSTRDQWVDATLDGTRTGSVSVSGREYRRDGSVAGGVYSGGEGFTSPISVSLGKTGKGTFTPPGQGAMAYLASPDGSVVFLLSDPTDRNTDFTFGAVVRAPQPR